jgi:hypothetical protein
MADRVPFLLRLDPEIIAALRRWAGDDLRSLNSEIEFLLRQSLQKASRLPDGRTAASLDMNVDAPDSPPAEGERK